MCMHHVEHIWCVHASTSHQLQLGSPSAWLGTIKQTLAAALCILANFGKIPLFIRDILAAAFLGQFFGQTPIESGRKLGAQKALATFRAIIFFLTKLCSDFAKPDNLKFACLASCVFTHHQAVCLEVDVDRVLPRDHVIIAAGAAGHLAGALWAQDMHSGSHAERSDRPARWRRSLTHWISRGMPGVLACFPGRSYRIVLMLILISILV